MGYGQGDDLADAYAELATKGKQLDEVKVILLQAALGEDITTASREWLEKNFPELTMEVAEQKKKW